MEYELEPVIVCDMAALVTLQGLYAVYHPASKYKCAWCKVTEDELHCWNKEWPRRNIEEMGEGAKGMSESKHKEWATNHEGVCDKPLIKIDFRPHNPLQLAHVHGNYEKACDSVKFRNL